MDDDVLLNCFKQSGQKLSSGVYDCCPGESFQMSHKDFKSLATPAITEDEFWAKIKDERIYSVRNAISLFGDETLIWNLDIFTKDQSLIHTKPSHRHLEVSV